MSRPLRRAAAAAARAASARRSWRGSPPAGTTSCMRQPLVAPTSMYSMKRSTSPRPRKCSAIAVHAVVVDAAAHDHVDLHGLRGPPRPLPRCRRGCARARRGVSLIARNVGSSSASRLTVTRLRPASASDCGSAREQQAVGRERDVLDPRQRSEHLDEPLEAATQQRLTAGEPDLSHALRRERSRRARAISSKLSSSLRSKKAWPGPKASRGMQ